MNKLGKKLFKNAAIGGGIGAVGGGIFGGVKAKQKIDALPRDTVTLESYEKPVMERVKVGRNSFTDGKYNGEPGTKKYADAPARNPDGAIKMEAVPEQTVEGPLKGRVEHRSHDIREPVGIRSYRKKVEIGDVSYYKRKWRVRYGTVGEWTEPVAVFEHGVNVAGRVLGYAAAGMAVGATGGALVTLALETFGGEKN